MISHHKLPFSLKSFNFGPSFVSLSGLVCSTFSCTRHTKVLPFPVKGTAVMACCVPLALGFMWSSVQARQEEGSGCFLFPSIQRQVDNCAILKAQLSEFQNYNKVLETAAQRYIHTFHRLWKCGQINKINWQFSELHWSTFADETNHGGTSWWPEIDARLKGCSLSHQHLWLSRPFHRRFSI